MTLHPYHIITMCFLMCLMVFALLIVAQLLSEQSLLLKWSKMMYGIAMLTNKSNNMVFRYIVDCQELSRKILWLKVIKIKQQPYCFSGFVFKSDKMTGFMPKPVKDRLWVWKCCYYCGTLFLDRKQFLSQISHIVSKPMHRKLVVTL